MFLAWLAVVPPEIAGVPTWVLNGLSIGTLVMFIVVGLATARLWTRSQVEELNKRHETEVTNLVARYEKHLERTVELWSGRADDALARENQWRETALTWQKTAEMLANGIEPMQEQSATALAILQAWQNAGPRPGGRR